MAGHNGGRGYNGGRGLVASALVVGGLVLFMIMQATSGNGGPVPTGAGSTANSNDAPIPPQTFLLEPEPVTTPTPATSNGVPSAHSAPAGIAINTPKRTSDTTTPAPVSPVPPPPPPTGPSQLFQPPTAPPGEPTPPPTSAPTTPIIPLPYQIIVIAYCSHRTLTVRVASPVASAASYGSGKQPTGEIAVWLSRPWDGRDEIGQAVLNGQVMATFREPPFVRAGREIDVYFDGNPSNVWSSATVSTESC
jgi:hypothetical protein